MDTMIETAPKDALASLEFDKVIALLQAECQGALGKEAVAAIFPKTDIAHIQQLLDEVAEALQGIYESDALKLGQYFDIRAHLRMLEVVDYVLPEEGLIEISGSLRLIQKVYQYFTKPRVRAYPNLFAIIEPVEFNQTLLAAIVKVVDEEGNIRPDASPELARLRRAKNKRRNELDRTFNKMVLEYKQKGWLTDNAESYRNGRRVLSVPAEHKRKIRGIIHDESSTGRTVFIEPEVVISINNDIFDIESEERKEIYRILKELSAKLRPFVEDLHTYQALLIRFDVILAKARLAAKMKAQKPRLVDRPHFNMVRAYHPLLLLKNQELDKKTVPFYLQLTKGNRILVISGPNAGGKSITMKGVGLIQLMVQAGMLVPADASSEIGIFTKVFTDIGDQQSLEDDLSTYSSRLENAKQFLAKADEKSLLLIDEFGSGTDPKIGGAIAESILRELNFRKVYAVITTHYSNIKIFAFKTRGIVNGSMTFDKETLSPAYELKVGRPGSSYAFEIATKTGLPGKVLKYARHRAGKNEKAVDQLLVDLQEEKREVEARLVEMDAREKKLERLIKNYDLLHRELEVRRKKIKLEQKEKDLQATALENKAYEQVIREIREAQNLEEAKAKAAAAKAEREAKQKEVVELRETVYYADVSNKAGEPIVVGDYVRLRTGGATGRVEAINKKKATIQIGDLHMTVSLRDLEHAKEPLDIRNKRSVKMDTMSRQTQFASKLDIRGMRVDQAIKIVEEYLDEALMANINFVEIVHGKGTGMLRKAVHRKVREYDVNMTTRHPEAELGGDGVTIVEIK